MPQSASHRVALYASVGPELTQYDVDVEAAALVRRSTVTLPANVHYAWPHVSGGGICMSLPATACRGWERWATGIT